MFTGALTRLTLEYWNHIFLEKHVFLAHVPCIVYLILLMVYIKWYFDLNMRIHSDVIVISRKCRPNMVTDVEMHQITHTSCHYDTCFIILHMYYVCCFSQVTCYTLL